MSYDSLNDRCLGFKISKNNNERVSHVVFFFSFFFFFPSVGRLGTDLMNFRWQVRVMANLLIPCKLLRNSKFLIICMNPLYLQAEMSCCEPLKILEHALFNRKFCFFRSVWSWVLFTFSLYVASNAWVPKRTWQHTTLASLWAHTNLHFPAGAAKTQRQIEAREL